MNRITWGKKAKTRNAAEPETEPDEVVNFPFAGPRFLEVVQNRIYFYSEIERDASLQLIKTLRELSNQIQIQSKTTEGVQDKIFLNINSFGGEIFSGMAVVDHIIRAKKDVEIISCVDGIAASMGSMLAVVCSKRQINRHSKVLIHQLSGGMWGKYAELEDEKLNLDNTMKMIQEIYLEYTKIPKSKLDELLKHDLLLDAKTCLKYGIVDEII